MTRAKEVKSGAQEGHKGKETKLQNKGDLESWFFYFITLCVETLPGTTPGCSFVLLKRDDTVPGLMLALEAGVGCSQERAGSVAASSPCRSRGSVALFKPLPTLDLVPESFFIILKSPHWKAGGGNQDRRVEQTLLWLVCQSPDNPQPVCPLRNSSWEGQDWNS